MSFDGTEIAVRAAGDPDAPVLLFTHGFSLDMSVWHEQWIDLADDFRCVLMDHRSHGMSGDAAHGDLSVRAMGRDIAAVLDAVTPDRPAVVVGHSMGSMAILAMAEQRPELFGTAGGRRGADRRVVLRPVPRGDGLGRRARAPAVRIVHDRGATRGPAPARGARESRRRRRSVRADDAVRSGGAAAPGRPHRRARRTRAAGGVDGRPRRTDGDGLPSRAAAGPRSGDRDRRSARPGDASGDGRRAGRHPARRHARRGRVRGTHGDARATGRGEPRHPRVRPEVLRGRRTAGERPSEAPAQGGRPEGSRRHRRDAEAHPTKKDAT